MRAAALLVAVVTLDLYVVAALIASFVVLYVFRLPFGVGAWRIEAQKEDVRSRGLTGCSWEVGSSATPTDLVDRLLALGLIEDDEPLRVGMALTAPPPDVPDVEVRRADFDDADGCSSWHFQKRRLPIMGQSRRQSRIVELIISACEVRAICGGAWALR